MTARPRRDIRILGAIFARKVEEMEGGFVLTHPPELTGQTPPRRDELRIELQCQPIETLGFLGIATPPAAVRRR